VAKKDHILYTADMAPVKLQQSPGAARSEPKGAGSTFVLAHVSDLHLAYPDGAGTREFLNKRALGYLNWRLRRQAVYRPEVLEPLMFDLCNERPDHIVVTGDLTHHGLPHEFARAAEWLRAVGPPSHVTVIPGNHDVYVSAPWDRTLFQWWSYMVSDGADASGSTMEELTLFPSLRVRESIALIGVSTARPSAPLLAVGSIGRTQLQRLDEMLTETGRKGLFRVILIHHPPVAGMVRWHRRLTDGRGLLAVLAQRGAELILHGHAHRTTIDQFGTAAGMTPVIGVAPASALDKAPGRGARYHLYHIGRHDGGWDVRILVRAYSAENGRFAPDDDVTAPRRLYGTEVPS
jgi:3',5'-cyclic AMP phosphodiesterase CpdA